MKKVYYSVKRYKRNEMIEQKGVGYITDTDLVIACISQNSKPYIRVFEDCDQEEGWVGAEQQHLWVP